MSYSKKLLTYKNPFLDKSKMKTTTTMPSYLNTKLKSKSLKLKSPQPTLISPPILPPYKSYKTNWPHYNKLLKTYLVKLKEPTLKSFQDKPKETLMPPSSLNSNLTPTMPLTL